MADGAGVRAVLAGHALGDADQQDGGDDRDDRAEDVELGDAAGAQRAGDDATDQGADDAEDERHEEAEVLLAGLDEPCDRADDEPEHEESDDGHGYRLGWRGWATPRLPSAGGTNPSRTGQATSS
jgi:hypothetical protein